MEKDDFNVWTGPYLETLLYKKGKIVSILSLTFRVATLSHLPPKSNREERNNQARLGVNSLQAFIVSLRALGWNSLPEISAFFFSFLLTK